MGRALRDFSKMSMYDRKSVLNKRIDDSSIVLKYGEVGDITVELIARFSDKYPFPAIFMYKKKILEDTWGNNIVVLYIPRNLSL